MSTSIAFKNIGTGFTLLETLVYVALFGLIMLGAFSGIVAIKVSSEHTQSEALLIEDGTFIGDRIQALVESASAIGTPQVHATSTELILMNGSKLTTIYAASSTLTKEYNGNSGALTDITTEVTDISFARSSSDDNPDHILISLTLENAGVPPVTVRRLIYLTP